MVGLIQKIFGKNVELKRETKMDIDEIKPFFESQGIDMEEIGFPCIETRNYISIDRYKCSFDKVCVRPVKIDNQILNVLTGKYRIQAVANRRSSEGYWIPGSPIVYSFEIKSGKLNIERSK